MTSLEETFVHLSLIENGYLTQELRITESLFYAGTHYPLCRRSIPVGNLTRHPTTSALHSHHANQIADFRSGAGASNTAPVLAGRFVIDRIARTKSPLCNAGRGFSHWLR